MDSLVILAPIVVKSAPRKRGLRAQFFVAWAGGRSEREVVGLEGKEGARAQRALHKEELELCQNQGAGLSCLQEFLGAPGVVVDDASVRRHVE